MANLTDLYLLVAAVQRYENFEERVYDIVNTQPLFDLWGQERKADFYSLLVESVKPTDRISTVEDKVREAYEKNMARYPQ